MSYTDFIKTTNQRLVELMSIKNITAKELSHLSGVSASQVYKILSGKCTPTIGTLFKLVSSLDINLQDFFNFKLPLKSLSTDNCTFTFQEQLKSISENLKVQQSKMSRLNGLTQSILAEVLGQADYKYIGYILNGRNNSYINIKISTFYNISMHLGLENEFYTLFKIN